MSETARREGSGHPAAHATRPFDARSLWAGARARPGPVVLCPGPVVLCLVAFVLLMGGLTLVPSTVDAQVVRGRVIVDGVGDVVADARLVLRDADGSPAAMAVSADDGRFVLRPSRVGRLDLEVSHIGYADWRTPVIVRARTDVEVEVRLAPEAIPLDPIRVVARTVQQLGPLAGFERRRADPSLQGYFIDEEDVERRVMATPSMLVLAAPGMRLALSSSAAGLERYTIMAGGCIARTYVDGVRIPQESGASVDDLLSPERIAGVEVYPRGLGAPMEYMDNQSMNCGLVLFWTKPPEATRGTSNTGRIILGVGALLSIVIYSVTS